MKRSPLRPRGWAPPRAATQSTYTPKPRAVAVAASALPMAAPVPKARPWRCKAYRMLVAALPCAHCGAIGYSQAAHGDLGKGAGIKTGDETCFPACGPRVGVEGCHEQIGRRMLREERRRAEQVYAAVTRLKLRAICAQRGIFPPVAES